MKHTIAALTILLLSATHAHAYDEGEVFVDPHVAVGYNVAQGTNFLVGLDLGYGITDQLAAGVGAFYSAGQRPEHDRAIGGGPFVAFFQPVASFLTFSVREDIDHIDQRTPVIYTDVGGSERYTHDNEHGVASITSVGIHLHVAETFGISVGYRAYLALSNTDIARNRSGTFLGFSIGI